MQNANGFEVDADGNLTANEVANLLGLRSHWQRVLQTTPSAWWQEVAREGLEIVTDELAKSNDPAILAELMGD